MRAGLNRLGLGLKMPHSKSLILRIIDIPGERRTIKASRFHLQEHHRREAKGTVEVLGVLGDETS